MITARSANAMPRQRSSVRRAKGPMLGRRRTAAAPAPRVSTIQRLTTPATSTWSTMDSNSTPATASAPITTAPRTTASRIGATVTVSADSALGRAATAAKAVAATGSSACARRAASAICAAGASAVDPAGPATPGRRRRPVDVQPLHHVVADLAGDADQQLTREHPQLGGPGGRLGLDGELAVLELDRPA